MVLTLPAAVGLLVLAEPVVALIFEHGAFKAIDTIQTALALRFYLIGLVFAAVDQPLVFAFYARKNTLTPALVGVLGVFFYTLVAVPTYRTLGMVGLILGNGAQLAGHAVMMIWLFQRQVGTLRGYGIGQTLFKSSLAAVAMGVVVYGVTWVIERALGQAVPAGGRAGWALQVALGGGAGLVVYLALCARLRVRELELLRQIGQRVRRTTR
jgi:putative peptidoglycan lipid II flippase